MPEDACTLTRPGVTSGSPFTVSQVSAGLKNLWIGHRNQPNQSIVKDPSLLEEGVRRYADLPCGHGEGYDDTFKQLFRRFYRTVADRSAPVEYSQFADGLRQLQILAEQLASSAAYAWMDV